MRGRSAVGEGVAAQCRRGATDVDTVLDVDARVRGLLQHPHLKGKVTFNDNDQGETRLMT